MNDPVAQNNRVEVLPKWDEFCAGVTACLRSWSALRTAVEGGWGGVESKAKAEFLRTTIYGYFEPVVQASSSTARPLVSQQDELEDHLAIFAEEEFSLQLEDGSEQQVAAVIWQLYQTCLVQGDASYAVQVVANALQVQQLVPSFPVHVQNPEDDNDNETDGDTEMKHVESDNVAHPITPVAAVTSTIPSVLPPAAEYASQYLFGEPPRAKQQPQVDVPVRQLGQAPNSTSMASQVDNDGFETVVKRRGRQSS